MAATTQEPTEFRAGDSVLWNKSLADYPADEWDLTYYFVGPAQKFTVTATADGNDHALEITAAISGNLQAGTYFYEAKVSDGTQTFTVVPTQSVRVLANFAGNDVTAGFDGRTYWRRCLDTLKDMYSGAVAFPEAGYTIMGERQVQLKTFDEVQKAIAWVESKVAQEDKAAAIARGERVGIYMRFRNPR